MTANWQRTLIDLVHTSSYTWNIGSWKYKIGFLNCGVKLVNKKQISKLKGNLPVECIQVKPGNEKLWNLQLQGKMSRHTSHGSHYGRATQNMKHQVPIFRRRPFHLHNINWCEILTPKAIIIWKTGTLMGHN